MPQEVPAYRSVMNPSSCTEKGLCVEGLLHVRSGVEPLAWCGSLEMGCRLRCRPREFTDVTIDIPCIALEYDCNKVILSLSPYNLRK
ncbi:hypothetical protein TNCV_2249691 [Trichonephila clavipes]|nr:hypothetical protein TNCV_2249691 [Trichonephila clavipes]